MRKFCRGFLITVFITSFQCLAENPSALEVLDKFAETQNNFRSFIAKTQTDSYKTSTGFSQRRPSKLTSSCEFRTDGYRLAWRKTTVGNIGNGVIYTQNDASYDSHLWDGQNYYCYVGTIQRAGDLVINKPIVLRSTDTFSKYFKNFAGSGAMGYFRGEPARIDKVLKKARSLSIRNNMEKVGGSMCHVLEGVTEYGKYKIWFDPSHGYNIAKAIHTQQTGDRTCSADYVLQNNERRQFTNETKKFKKVGGKWFPVEFSYKGRFKYKQGMTALSKSHIIVVDMKLNPDHEKLKSFIPDDIPNGAFAVDGDAPEIDYRWQDGKLIPTDPSLPIKSP